MKKPKNLLPWMLSKSDLNVDTYSYQIEQIQDENLVIADIPCEEVGDKQDAEYIVQACNNFPKAVELLTKLSDQLHDPKISHDLDAFLIQDLDLFLKELDK